MSQVIEWCGTVVSVQPRIRLLRSFDQSQHSYLGYVIGIDGNADGESKCFLVAVGKAVVAKFQLQVGHRISGTGQPVLDPRLETAELYKVATLKVPSAPESTPNVSPPWHGVPPDLSVYRQRGHRRLDARVYSANCTSCLWGCRMPVEMIIDQWKPEVKKYRFETFCYGPKSCAFYRPGKERVVPGRRGMSWVEEDWIDEQATAHRGPDD